MTSSALDFCHIVCPSNYANNSSHIFDVQYGKLVVEKAHRYRIYAIKGVVVSGKMQLYGKCVQWCVLRKVCLESMFGKY